MKGWYGGSYVDPLDRMTQAELLTMKADALDAHRWATAALAEAQATGNGQRVYVLTDERRRLAAIHNEVKRRAA